MSDVILYECDRKNCFSCDDTGCQHTTDIDHAKNFEFLGLSGSGDRMYTEISSEEKSFALTPDTYQRLAMKTCSIPYDNKEDMIRHAVFGLTSEAGEVAGIYQKVYQGHKIDREHVKKELGDCLWMIAEACTALDFSLEEVMATNIEKLRKRYPEGFDAEHSLHRAEGDI